MSRPTGWPQTKAPMPFCAVCGDDILPIEVAMRPLGRDGALVRVCPGCDPQNSEVR